MNAIRALAEMLTFKLADKSIRLEAGQADARLWAAAFQACGLQGYPDADTAERVLRETLLQLPASVFLVEEIWFDTLENQVDAALGYAPNRIVFTREGAEAIVKSGGTIAKGRCWAMVSDMPRYRLKELPLYKE